MIEIDGGFGEAGGAILRMATALSAVTGKACRIYNIRKGRQQPGLKTQHLESIQTLARICSAKLTGDRLGSTEIEFHPGKTESKHIQAIIKTAGSPGLLFQNIKIPASFGEKEIIINVKGGAIAGLGAPPIPYLQNVTFPVLENFGYRAECEIKKYGFYPKGGAEVEFKIQPWKEENPLVLTEQGKVLEIKGISLASKHLEKARVAERQAESAKNILTKEFSIEPKIEIKYVDALCPGSVIVLWARTNTECVLGSDQIGKIGIRSEQVGEMAGQELVKELKSGACLDKHLSDQVLIFMALTKGKSEITVSEITKHCLTNIWIIEQFLPVKFAVEGEIGRPGKISVESEGF